MSTAATRDAIAADMSEVDGLTGHPKRPAVIREGDCWPLWAGAVREDGPAWPGFVQQWTVVVALPGDEVAASDYADARLDDIVDALRPTLAVTEMLPAELPTEAGPMLALMITGRTE